MTQVRSWLSRRSRWLWPAITAVAVAVAVMSVVARASRRRRRTPPRSRTPRTQRVRRNGRPRRRRRLRRPLEAAVFDGQSLAQIAAANGIERQTVVDAITAKINEDIDAALADGELTETQADRFRDSIAEKSPTGSTKAASTADPDPANTKAAATTTEDCTELAALLGHRL